MASNNQLRVVQCPCAYPVSIRTHVLLLTCVSYIRRREKFRALSITFVVGLNGASVLNNRRQVKRPNFCGLRITAMPANKGNLSTPHKEKSGNGLTTGASKKKKRCTVKHKRHCKQYLVSERIETLIPWQMNGHIAVESRATQVSSIWNVLYLQILDTSAIKSLKYVD